MTTEPNEYLEILYKDSERDEKAQQYLLAIRLPNTTFEMRGKEWSLNDQSDLEKQTEYIN
jgi:hypothetical protein